QPGKTRAGDAAVEPGLRLGGGGDDGAAIGPGPDKATVSAQDVGRLRRGAAKGDDLPLDREGWQVGADLLTQEPRPGAGGEHHGACAEVPVKQAHPGRPLTVAEQPSGRSAGQDGRAVTFG